MQASGLGDAAYFGPEPEFFVFDSVRWQIDASGASYKIGSEEAPWSTGATFEGGNMGHRPALKGGYFPVPPVDHAASCEKILQKLPDMSTFHFTESKMKNSGSGPK